MRVHSLQDSAGRLSMEVMATVVTQCLASCDTGGSTEHIWMLNLGPSPCAVALKHPTGEQPGRQTPRESLRPFFGTPGTH